MVCTIVIYLCWGERPQMTLVKNLKNRMFHRERNRNQGMPRQTQNDYSKYVFKSILLEFFRFLYASFSFVINIKLHVSQKY